MTTIGDAAFARSGIISISIPSSVTAIYSSAFNICSSLSSITVASGNSKYDSRSNCNAIIEKSTNYLILGCKNTVIPRTVKRIQNGAFYGCSDLSSITIPFSVSEIGERAFQDCSGLKSIIIASSVTNIDGYAFYQCEGLTKVIISDIAAWCNISFSNNYSNPLCYAKHIYNDADTEITNLTIPSNVSTIKAYSFIGCTGIKTITIPYSVNTIGYSAFEECSGLTKVIASNISKWCNISFSNWGANPLYYAKHLYSDANTEITNLTIPSNVTSIGAYSFIGCSGVKNITIPNGVNTIGYSAFEGCTGITSITLPYALTSISSSLLKGCTGLSSINIPSCVSTIGYNAFSGCTNLKTVTIPKSVNTIENSAFNGCNNLTLVKVYIESPISITNTTFSNRTNATLCVLRGCGAAYEAATYWTDFKDIVEVIDFVDATVKSKCVANWDTNGDGELSEIEAAEVTDLGRVFEGSNITSFEELQFFTGLTSIGAAAFSGCYDLRSVIIPEGILSIGNGAFAQTPIYEVKIPASVQTIGEYAFGGKWDDCPDNDESYCYVYYPVKYTVDSNNQAYASASGILYNKEKTKLIDVPYGLCQDIYFPSTLKEIPANAFSERACLDGKNLYINNLTKFCQINIIGTPYSSYPYYNGSVYSKIDKIYIYEDGAGYQVMNGTLSIPSDVTSIGRGTFYGCKQLSKVTFPSNGVTQIGDYAFGATKITEVALPATVQTIGSKAFYDTWTESVNTGETDDDGDLIYSSVEWTMALSSLIVPQSVQAIGSNAFNLENNASVTSKNTSPTSISSDAFKNASNCKLKVGLGLQNTYSQKTGWNTFGTIEEEEIIPYIEGEIFTATTPEGIEMTFKVLSATNKTAQVGDGRNPAIDQSFDGDLIIPSQIKGLNITDVGCYAFYDCQNLQSVTIQEGIVRLGETGREENMTYGPFMKAKIAKSINLPSTVTFIGMFSFAYSEIGKFTIPPTVTYLEMCAFKGANIGYLDIPYSETAISYGRERVPGENWTAFGYANIGKLTIDRNINHSFVDGYSSVIAPFSHTTIGELHVGHNGNIHSDLCDCKVTDYYPRLEEELVKGSFYYTQYSVYAGRSSCTNLYLPEGFITITSVPQGTQSISIPSTVTSIAENAFAETNISSVTVYIKDPLPITENSFTDRRLYATLCVPYGCKAAYENADYWKEFKEIIEMPGSIEFADANVESLCIANWDRNGDGKLSTNEAAAVTSLGEVFKGNTEIESFNELQYFIGLTNIGNGAFDNCTGLTSVTIPTGVTSIGSHAFYCCRSLTSVTIPNSVTSIGSDVFSVCSSLSSIIVEGGNPKYDSRSNCNAIIETSTNSLIAGCMSTVIPNGITSIGFAAFSGHSGLTSVTIPNSVTSIESFAFYESGLTFVKVNLDNPQIISWGVFYGCYNATLIVPVGHKIAYQAANYWKEFKRIIEDIDGDVNGDGESDVLDVVDIARYVVGTPAETFVPILADINSSGEVNIADAVCLVNDIAGDQNFAKPMMAPRKTETSEDVLTLTEGENGLSLALENQRDYTAFQFDLYVPEDVDVAQMQLNAQRKQKHQLLYNKVEDGHWRGAALSTSNRTFLGNDGELLSIALDGISNECITLSDIHFFDADGNDYLFDDITLEGVTGVETIHNSQFTVHNSNIYDIQGRRHAKLQRGLNIVNGKKVVVK